MKHHFAAEIPKELADEVRASIAQVRDAPAPRELAGEGANLILRLTEACLDSYFVRPVRAMKVGLVAEKATVIGVKAAHRAIALFVRRITGGLSDEQIRTLADQLEGMLFTRR